MKWVKLILPPRARRRWLLTTIRLSDSSLAGTARTLVAVGTVSEISMLAATRASAPRSGVVAASAGTGTGGLPARGGAGGAGWRERAGSTGWVGRGSVGR